jgi:hypothetical protein
MYSFSAYFILWSEFHAELLSYRYLFRISKDFICVEDVVHEWKLDFDFFLKTNNNIQVVADYVLRLYGRYLALYCTYDDRVEKYPKGWFINPDFLDLYEYVDFVKTFETIKTRKYEWENILHNLEPKS